MFLNSVIIFGIVGICVNVSPFVREEAFAASYALINLSDPEGLANKAKSKISYYISDGDENNNNTQSEELPVMNSIGSEDSDDDQQITETPKDVAKLMKEAKKRIKKSDAIGKTSEEAYQGGGTIISLDDVEIQSKIPKSFYNPDIEKLLKQGAQLKIKDKS
ncbi:MAG: hypothetical protein IKI34_05630, partial [Eubacterium sp.]|nr:hypothetical protein [Eubacterium sp.]